MLVIYYELVAYMCALPSHRLLLSPVLPVDWREAVCHRERSEQVAYPPRGYVLGSMAEM